MESKVILALALKRQIVSYALFRQRSIDANRFEDAMTNHFLFLQVLDEHADMTHSMTQGERNHLMMAWTCLDYTSLYN